MSQWQKLAELTKIPDKQIVGFVVRGISVIVYRVENAFHCFADFCTHQDIKLSEFGEVEAKELVCYAHGARFDLTTGAPLCFPATEPLKRYAVKVDGAHLLINLEEAAHA